jgi:hypothetical protein
MSNSKKLKQVKTAVMLADDAPPASLGSDFVECR